MGGSLKFPKQEGGTGARYPMTVVLVVVLVLKNPKAEDDEDEHKKTVGQ